MADTETAPGYPSFFDKVNFIVQFLQDPCDAPLTIWVEHLKPAALEFLFTYYEPDLQNILVNLFRWRYIIPRTRTSRKGRGGRKSKRGPVGRWVRTLISFDQDEWLSRRINNFARLPRKQVSKLFATLVIVEGVVERVNFWLFIIALFTDFFYTWSSLMKRSVYCQAQGDDVLLVEGPDQDITGVFGWVALVLPYVRKQRGRVTWNVSSGTFSGDTAAFSLQCTIAANSSFEAKKCGIRVSIYNGVFFQRSVEDFGSLKQGESGSLMVSGHLAHGDRFVIEHSLEFGIATFGEPVFLLHGENESDEDEEG